MPNSSNIAKNIPTEVWIASIKVIQNIIHPVTAVTVGVGKLIEQKFSTLNEVQKIYAKQTIQEAKDKVNRAAIPDFSNVVVKPQVIYTVIENADNQIDDSLRDLWSNLTARELSEGSVHPEIARIFSKLTSADIVVLSELHSRESSFAKTLLKALASTYTLGIMSDPKSFHHIYLKELGLIENISGKWLCTTKGKELIRSISVIEKEANKPNSAEE